MDDFSTEHLGVTIPAEKNDGEECYQNLWPERMKYFLIFIIKDLGTNSTNGENFVSSLKAVLIVILLNLVYLKKLKESDGYYC